MGSRSVLHGLISESIIQAMDRISPMAAFGAFSGDTIPDILPATAAWHLSDEDRRTMGDFARTCDELTGRTIERISQAGIDNLDEALDLLLEDESLAALRSHLAATLPLSVVQRAAHPSGPSDLLPGAPPYVAEKILLATQIQQLLAVSLMRLIAGIEGKLASSRGPLKHPPIAPKTALEHIFDPKAVPQFRAISIAARLGEFCCFALMSGKVTSWVLANELTERWLHGLRGLLGVMVAIELVSEEIDLVELLPGRYKLNLQSIVEELRESHQGSLLAFEQVEKTGKGYPQVYLADED